MLTILTKDYNVGVSVLGLAQLVSETPYANIIIKYRTQKSLMLTKFHVYISGVLFFKVLIGKTPSHGSTNDDGVDLRHHVRSIVHEKWNTQLFDIQLLRHHKFEEEMVWLLQGVIYCVVQYLNR